MESRRELSAASREALLALITAQDETIATLERRVADLERRLSSPGGGRMPGTKPVAAARPRATGQPRKRRPHGAARRRSATPTDHVVHAAAACPQCQTPLSGGWVQRTREVIELPTTPVRVIEHRYVARVCGQCRRRVLPPAALGAVVAGRQRLGAGLVSLIVTLREEDRLPVRTIQRLLTTLYGLRLSVGTITAASQRVAQAAAPLLTRITAALRAEPAVYADETGWREAGRNRYVWLFGSDRWALFVAGSRQKTIVDQVLGTTAGGVLGCDFYAAYHHYPGKKQRCWSHLLRAIHALRQLYPTDAAVAAWAQAIHAVFVAARAEPLLPPEHRRPVQQRYAAQLAALCAPYAHTPGAVQRRLSARMLRHLEELFVFVGEPGVAADNNAAERGLRHLVTARKISGGTRSPAGTATKMALASLFGTARLRGTDPLLACFAVLMAHQV